MEPIRLSIANGVISADKGAWLCVDELELWIMAYILEDSPPALSAGLIPKAQGSGCRDCIPTADKGSLESQRAMKEFAGFGIFSVLPRSQRASSHMVAPLCPLRQYGSQLYTGPADLSSVELGDDRDSVEDGGNMAPFERRFGHPFTGLVLPFGALVNYLPPIRVRKAAHKFAQKTRRVFLGWHLSGQWS